MSNTEYTLVYFGGSSYIQTQDPIAGVEQHHAELLNKLRTHNGACNITVALVVLPPGGTGNADIQSKLGVARHA